MARQFEKSVSDESQPEEGSGEDEGIALDDDDVESVDQDAIPQRKVQVDNKVHPSPTPVHWLAQSYFSAWAGCARTHTGHHQTRRITPMDRDVDCFIP